MQISIIAAGFTPGEADGLRRAMAAWKSKGGLDKYYDKIVEGMAERGYTREFAEDIFKQIHGFSEYGFPESHAASFALLVYASCWLKCHHPAEFLAAMLNSAPLGFYSASQLVQDAQRHGVVVRPVDVMHSDYDCTLEELAQRTGCAAWAAPDLEDSAGGAQRIVAARAQGAVRQCRRPGQARGARAARDAAARRRRRARQPVRPSAAAGVGRIRPASAAEAASRRARRRGRSLSCLRRRKARKSCTTMRPRV